VLRPPLIEKGPEGLLKALKKMPRVGYLRLPGQLGYDLRYAWQVPLEGGGRRILPATDRRIGFRETRNHGSDTDYPFPVLEIASQERQGRGQAGDGGADRLNKAANIIELANYSDEPVRLNTVHRP
jgi:hypothetical protein